MSISELIEELLSDISDEFTPPLKETVNIKEYVEKILRCASIISIIDDGKVAGFVAIYCNDPEKRIGYVTMLAVAKTHRIYGIGTQLIKMTIEYLKKRGFEKLTLEIYKTNQRAMKFYKKSGFLIEKETAKSVFACKYLQE